MKPFARIILVSSLALAAGCVSRMDLEHWTLEPCADKSACRSNKVSK